MPHTSSLPVALLATVLSFGPTLAAADPVSIAAGSFLDLRPFSPLDERVIHLEGISRGFTLDATGINLTNYVFFQDCSGSPPGASPCDPGQRISLNAGWSGSDFGATVSLDGRTFGTGLGGFPDQGSALVDFQSSFVVPVFDGMRRVTITAPFTFTGGVAPPVPGRPIYPGATLVGQGTVRADLSWGPSLEGPSSWTAERALYTFEAPATVPEPATLVLVGSGLVTCVIRRRRTRVRHADPA